MGLGGVSSKRLEWPYPQQVLRIFWQRVDKKASTKACWEWKRQRDDEGYGVFVYRDREYMAHRVACAIKYKRDIPQELVVLHSCDNPPCCNPHHLTPGTQAQNIADRVAKGRTRYGTVAGEAHYKAKLTMDQAREIRRRREEQGYTYRELAHTFGVNEAVISDIINKRTYREDEGDGPHT